MFSGEDGNVVSTSTFQNSEESPSKRFKLSLQDVDSSEKSSPLGLKLRKTPSFVSLVQKELSQKRATNNGSDHHTPGPNIHEFRSQPTSEKLKASNTPVALVKIGSWEKISSNEGDLVAKCYFAKKKLVWEVLQGALKSKIEMQWSDIIGIRAQIGDTEPGILEIELNQPPAFFRETEPQPRKHTLWYSTSDFTRGEALQYRKHSAIFSPGYLEKHYEKLLQADPRLLMLSQKPFPTQASPYFDPNIYGWNNFPYVSRQRAPEFPHLTQFHPVPKFPTSVDVDVGVAPFNQFHNFKHATAPFFGITNSTSPMSVINSRRLDERGSNYALDNESSSIWDQGLNNAANSLGMGYQIQTNLSFPYQDDHPAVVYGEETGGPNLNTGDVLVRLKKFLFEDSDVALHGEVIQEDTTSMVSLIEPLPRDNNSFMESIVGGFDGFRSHLGD